MRPRNWIGVAPPWRVSVAQAHGIALHRHGTRRCAGMRVGAAQPFAPDFPQSKIAETRAEVWAKNCAKNSAHFRASFGVQNDPQIFSQNSSQFITPCLMAETSNCHLCEFRGAAKLCQTHTLRDLQSLALPRAPSMALHVQCQRQYTRSSTRDVCKTRN